MRSRKFCFVPGCKNTTIKFPNKVFVTVPKDKKRKTRWFEAVRRSLNDVSDKTVFYCCEDHFNLEHDMANYMEYKMSHVRAQMKPDTVPHFFVCQPDKDQTSQRNPRLTSKNGLQRKENENTSDIKEEILNIDFSEEPSIPMCPIKTEKDPLSLEGDSEILTDKVKIEETELPFRPTFSIKSEDVEDTIDIVKEELIFDKNETFTEPTSVVSNSKEIDKNTLFDNQPIFSCKSCFCVFTTEIGLKNHEKSDQHHFTSSSYQELNKSKFKHNRVHSYITE